MKKISLCLILPLLLASACSSEPTKTQIAEADNNEKAYQTSYAKYAENSQVAKINLTTDGKIDSIYIGNQNLRAPTRKAAPEQFGVTFVKELGLTTRTVLGGNAVMAYVAIKGFETAGDRITDSYNNQEANQQNQSNQANQANQANIHEEANQQNVYQETNETIGGDKAGGDIDKSQEANQQNDSSSNDSENGGNVSNPPKEDPIPEPEV